MPEITQKIGSIAVKRGHKCWLLDIATREITEVKTKTVNVQRTHLFCSALNKRNAEKQFVKMLTRIKEQRAKKQNQTDNDFE